MSDPRVHVSRLLRRFLLRRFSANLTLLFTERQLADRIPAAARAGFHAIEIQYPYDLPAPELKALKEDWGLDVTVINVPSDLPAGGIGNASIPGREEEFKRAVDRALLYGQALKPRAVNLLAGAPPRDCFSRARCIEVLARNAAYAAEAFHSVGARALLEAVNHHDRPEFLLTSTVESVDVVRLAGHPNLGIQYDLYHMYKMGEELVSTAARHMSLIGNIQFADCPGRGEPGTGTIDFKSVFLGIDKAGWNGYYSAEYKPAAGTEAGLGWMKTLSA